MILYVSDHAVEINEKDSGHEAKKAQHPLFSNLLPSVHSRVSIKRGAVHLEKTVPVQDKALRGRSRNLVHDRTGLDRLPPCSRMRCP